MTWICLLGLGAGMAWLVATHTLVAYLAQANPEAALKIQPNDPVALLNRAELAFEVHRARMAKADALVPGTDKSRTRLSRFAPPGAPANDTPPASAADRSAGEADGPPAPSLDQIRDWTLTALKGAPVNARAFNLLGRIADISPEPAGGLEVARRYFELAARLSLQETEALLWLMRDSVDNRDYPKVIRLGDALMKTRSYAGEVVFPVLARLAETPEAKVQVKALLASNPDWRPRFLGSLPRYITDARTPLELLLALKSTPHPPTNQDLRPYLDFLMERKFHQLAYYAWLQFIPPEALSTAGNLYNGNFGNAPSGLPFDWTLSAGTGATAEIAQPPDETGGRALKVQFLDGRVEFGGVSQRTMLAPGAYTLSGRQKGEFSGRRGLRWRVSCPTGVIAETAMTPGTVLLWETFKLEFKIPAKNCEVQDVRLVHDARSSSERLATGTMWYDDLRIDRVRPSAPGQ